MKFLILLGTSAQLLYEAGNLLCHAFEVDIMGGQTAQINEPRKRGDSCMPGKTVRFAGDQVHFLKAEKTIKNGRCFPFGLKTVSNGRNVGHLRMLL